MKETNARRSHSAGLPPSVIVLFWLLMATEKLAVNAIIARMAEAKLQLALPAPPTPSSRWPPGRLSAASCSSCAALDSACKK